MIDVFQHECNTVVHSAVLHTQLAISTLSWNNLINVNVHKTLQSIKLKASRPFYVNANDAFEQILCNCEVMPLREKYCITLLNMIREETKHSLCLFSYKI